MAGAQGGPADLATAVCLTATIAEVHETQATLKHATFALFKSEDRKVCCRGCNFPTFPSLKLRSMPSTFPHLKPKPQQICLLLRKGRPNAAWMYLNLYASSRKLPTITRQTYLNCACLPSPQRIQNVQVERQKTQSPMPWPRFKNTLRTCFDLPHSPVYKLSTRHQHISFARIQAGNGICQCRERIT